MPPIHRAKGAAGTDSSGEMLHKKAPTVVRSGGVPPSHRGKEAARSGSTGENLQKAATASSGGMAPINGAKEAAPAGTGSSREILHKKAPTVIRSGKGAVRSGSTGEILQKKAATTSSGGVLPVPVDTGSMPPMKTTTASSGGSQPRTHARKAKTGLRTEKMPWNSSTKVNPTIGAKDSEQSAAKHRTIKGKAHAVLSDEERQHEIAANKALHAREEEEGRLFIQELNELRQGEYVSFEEFVSYAEKLAAYPPWINLNVKLEDEELIRRLHCLHGLYRFRYYKYKLSQRVSKKELRADKLIEDNPGEEEKEDGTTLKEDNPEEEEEDTKSKDEFLQDINEADCTLEFIQKQGYFNRFVEDGTVDWFFHPDYIYCASLDDYQRLVLRNYGGYEYARWADYHKYLQTYKMELEYLKYYEKLSKDLNWMKNYLHIEYTSPKEFLDNICTLYSELDDLYFELWHRVCLLMISFKDALKEVYNLNKFPLHQPLIKRALEFDNTLEFLEQKFNEFMDNITSDDKKDKAPQKWIAEAVKKQFDMPKTYEQYIRKKIGIACAIRIDGIEAIE
ncbi:hypothetical protein BRADI_1g72727v3 [Brachypodium distachyon]|uniref:Uncharacterized protein n=1 Tax=Brachypodium distachyon TaxID=15368 RepID=A0A0Q3K0J0_BRADI|nr:hypothetical protein BRADI_1g72727v3 [Brachypodium distachyon]